MNGITDEETTPIGAEADDTWMHIEEVKKLRSAYANQIFVQPLGDSNIRVNFGEVLDDEPRYHTALVLSASNALQFAQLIERWARITLGEPELEEATQSAIVNG